MNQRLLVVCGFLILGTSWCVSLIALLF